MKQKLLFFVDLITPKKNQKKIMEKKEKALDIINKHVLFSAVGSAIPIPILDLAAVTSIQVKMLNELCDLFEIEKDSNKNRIFITSALSSISARLGVSMIKSIPFIGSFISTPASITLNMMSTYSLGKAFVTYYSMNSTVRRVTDFKKNEFFDIIEKQFSKTKANWDSIINNVTKSEKNKLKERLLAKITEEQFEIFYKTKFKLYDNKSPKELFDSKEFEKLEQVVKLVEYYGFDIVAKEEVNV